MQIIRINIIFLLFCVFLWYVVPGLTFFSPSETWMQSQFLCKLLHKLHRTEMTDC